MAEARFKAEALGILRHRMKQRLELIDTLFTWLRVFIISSGLQSFHFVALKFDSIPAVCPDSSHGHKGVYSLTVCVD